MTLCPQGGCYGLLVEQDDGSTECDTCFHSPSIETGFEWSDSRYSKPSSEGIGSWCEGLEGVEGVRRVVCPEVKNE